MGSRCSSIFFFLKRVLFYFEGRSSNQYIITDTHTERNPFLQEPKRSNSTSRKETMTSSQAGVVAMMIQMSLTSCDLAGSENRFLSCIPWQAEIVTRVCGIVGIPEARGLDT